MFKKCFLGFFIYIGTFTSIMYGYTISSNEIDNDYILIQVGAFSKNESVQKALKVLEHYPVYLQKSPKLIRIFVPHAKKKKDLVETIQEIRKYFPGAFVKKSVKQTHKVDYQQKKSLPGSPHHMTHRRQELLNTESILRTRKKFF